MPVKCMLYWIIFRNGPSYYTESRSSILAEGDNCTNIHEKFGIDGLTKLPVLDLPGNNFYILHITALVSLFTNIGCSLVVFAILKPTFPGFWTRSSGQRFAFYLALGDLCISIRHSCDHAYMLVVLVVDHPLEDACIAMAFVVANFFLVQSLMVSFMAFSVFMLVVKEMKISLGRYDWRFLSATFLVPIAVTSPLAGLRWLGPAGGWCVADVRKLMGRLVAYIQNIIMVVTMLVNFVCYLFVWIKIKQVAKGTEAMGATTRGDNNKAARVMMKFVAAYIVQWSSNVIYYFWSLFAIPPFFTVHLVVFTCNLGWLFNLIAYTVGRDMGTGGKKANSTTNKKDNISLASTN